MTRRWQSPESDPLQPIKVEHSHADFAFLQRSIIQGPILRLPTRPRHLQAQRRRGCSALRRLRPLLPLLQSGLNARHQWRIDPGSPTPLARSVDRPAARCFHHPGRGLRGNLHRSAWPLPLNPFGAFRDRRVSVGASAGPADGGDLRIPPLIPTRGAAAGGDGGRPPFSSFSRFLPEAGLAPCNANKRPTRKTIASIEPPGGRLRLGHSLPESRR